MRQDSTAIAEMLAAARSDIDSLKLEGASQYICRPSGREPSLHQVECMIVVRYICLHYFVDVLCESVLEGMPHEQHIGYVTAFLNLPLL